MSLRIATFNAENLMHRFDFGGFHNKMRRDRAMHMVDIKDEEQFRRLEEARIISHTDDTMQLTALAIADTRADIVCLQEVENIEALNAFEHGYLYKMIGHGYRNKYLIEGNDGRGIDVAVITRDETSNGEKIELVSYKSHAGLTYSQANLLSAELKSQGVKGKERIFRRDCLELNLLIGGRALSLFVVHFKSMGGGRKGIDGRTYTMPVRTAEAKAVRQIISKKFDGKTDNKRWLICGDMNDYQSRLIIEKKDGEVTGFVHTPETYSSLDELLDGDFSHNLVSTRDVKDQWTVYHTRGPDYQHLCQLDYILASPKLSQANPNAIPDIVRGGQPYRTIFPSDQEVTRYPRTGWDRPKSSDHCPVSVSLNII